MTTVEKLFKNPNSRFLEVECKNCHNKQIIFNKATAVIKCNNCGKVLARPTGGKSEILTKIIRVGDENNDLHLLSSAQNLESTPAITNSNASNRSIHSFSKKSKINTLTKKVQIDKKTTPTHKKQKSKNTQKQ